jgi:hypothetical protein
MFTDTPLDCRNSPKKTMPHATAIFPYSWAELLRKNSLRRGATRRARLQETPISRKREAKSSRPEPLACSPVNFTAPGAVFTGELHRIPAYPDARPRFAKAKSEEQASNMSFAA